jgi:hypothetical protein
MHTSHSSINSYLYCGKAFELEKIKKYESPPAWWLLGGSAVHTATEWLDTDGWDGSPEEAFHYAFHLECQEARESGWEDDSQWRMAGYGNNKQGYEHWAHKGPLYVRQWAELAWCDNWDSTLVELDVSTVLPSGIEIRGFVDRVGMDHTRGMYEIIDMKTSTSRPESDQQLGIYSVLVELALPGVSFGKASNYMFKDNEFYEMDVSNWTLDTVDKLAQEWKNGVEASVFLPSRGSKCFRCGVADACYLQSGDTEVTRVYDSLNPNYEG